VIELHAITEETYMSWQQINHILGLAMIDQAFAQQLLENPLDALHARGIKISEKEQEVLCESKANDIQELSRYLLANLANEG